MWRLAIVLLAVLSAAAQTPNCDPPVLSVRVLGASAHPPAEIKTHLHVYLGGHELTPVRIEYGRTLRNTFILLDASGSMKTPPRWGIAQDVTRTMAELTLEGEVKVAAFGDSVSPFIDRKAVVESTALPFPDLLPVERNPQRTALLDAIAAAVHSPRVATSDDIIVVVTDGGDNHSSTRANKLFHEVLDANLRVFAVMLAPPTDPDTPEEIVGQQTIAELVQKSGGESLYLFPLDQFPHNRPVDPTGIRPAEQAASAWYTSLRSAFYVQLPALPHAAKIKVELSPKIKGARVLYPREVPACVPRP